tara:strand:- start:1828 stop:2436 length:609 start_codon:yes stop_codon:yes gene_type:complete
VGAPIKQIMTPKITNTFIDGKVVQIEDCLPDDLDHNTLFHHHDRAFPFPGAQLGELQQYRLEPSERSPALNEKLDQLRVLLKVPDEYVARVALHEIMPGQFIPPHLDQDYFGGLTIFLNRDWDQSWGGWGIAYEGDEFAVTAPKYGCGVFYRTPLYHCTSPVYQRDMRRRSIQIFYVLAETLETLKSRAPKIISLEALAKNA